MVWNVQFQIAALILILVVALMCVGQKKLNFQTERAFNRMLLAMGLSVIFDILSVVAINYRDSISNFLLNLSCKLYLFSLVTVACLAAWFAVAEVSYSFKHIWKTATAFPLVVELVVLIIFPIEVYVDAAKGELYSEGICVILTYVIGFLYLFSTLAAAIILRGYIQLQRRKAIYFWLFSWIFAAAVQFLNNQLLIASFSMGVACIYMFVKVENPEYHMDPATHVFNRKGFGMLMEEYIKFHRRKALISVSIDNLNVVNEIFGNTTVDDLTREISSYLQSIENATVFRLDDNLFTLTVGEENDMERTVSGISQQLNGPWEVKGVQVQIEGNVCFHEDVSIFKNVDELEDVVHYFAKEVKKRKENLLMVGSDELKKRLKTLEVQRALEWAISNNGVEMYYQPIYNINAGKFTAMEALVRIKDEKGGLIMPNEFIEYAEKNGMILKLGEMIFRKVCEFIQRNHIEEYGIEYIEVNLSVVQCMQDDLARDFMNIMGEYQIPPHKINLEITETAAINTRETLEMNMHSLLNYGTTFSLDDYGSGYSNLTYVVEMPLKIIKIDRSLTIAYADSEKAKVATEYTVEMLHKLGMEIVVEGIETEEQYQAFKKLGVEFIQGFYFAKPLPKERVLNYVQEWL